MFERFTDRARRVVVLAQDEARELNHNYIGTEHILLGLISEGDGVAAVAPGAMGISLEAVRSEVVDHVVFHVEGRGEERDQCRLVELAVQCEVGLPAGPDPGGEVVPCDAGSDDPDTRSRGESILDVQSSRERDALDVVLAASGDAQCISSRRERGDVEARVASGGERGLALVSPGLS